ncbi:MAG TPA: methylated-DNA--[protein]-cysteine S-methyltransferase [Firmicutes bacterium]|jgi:methylated-DNA-[protein]-cysteine S-methyltransferase|nr:methylated-DNA--[protein]-cysteine S-methyltransferase [Bacillota bacterium]
MQFCQYDSPIAPLWLGEENGRLSLLVFSKDDSRLQGYVDGTTPLLEQAKKQLDEYFSGRRKQFEIPLVLHGTEFQQRVWRELQAIPYGQTHTYKEVAVRVECPKGSRAVGLANNRNPISIIIPCHRVVGQNGKLTGYAGGLDSKQHLLDLEQRYV